LLAALALIDSTSIGTIVIPIWFLLAATQIRIGKFLLYLTTVAVFYFIIGFLGLLGMVSFLQALGGIFTSQIFLYAEILAGVALFIGAFWLDPKRRQSSKESHLQKWQRLVFTGRLSSRAVVGLALAATTLELATMAPYIGALAILASDAWTWLQRLPLLGGYVLVMVLPAIVLLGLRLTLHRKLEPYLKRFNAWLIKNADDLFSWMVGIIGSALACDGLVRLIISFA
jgi:hypothetical protein